MSESSRPELTVLMPCLNEAETIATCIKKAQACIKRLNLNAEIVISDNGSTDGSQKIAEDLGARVIHVKEKNQGYGSGIRWGVNAARGKYVIMGDSDDSYDWSKLDNFIEKLREGHELVMGNRFKGGIEKGAMPVLHRYLGNPVISWLGRTFFNVSIGDFNCGMRGFTKEAYQRIDPKTRGMDHATEIVVRAGLNNLDITEVPTTLSPDGRSREPHLRTWSDGWRVLRFLLMFSPAWLFLYPGLILTSLCTIASFILFSDTIFFTESFGVGIKTLIYALFGLMIGLQFIFFYYFAKIYAVINQISPRSKRFDSLFGFITLEKGLIVGALVFFIGLGLGIFNLKEWADIGFGEYDDQHALKMVLLSAFMIALGLQMIVYSFVFSIQGLQLVWNDDKDEIADTDLQ